MKRILGLILGPLIAIPLAGCLLLALGRPPNLGFYPFDGTHNSKPGVAPLPKTASTDRAKLDTSPSPIESDLWTSDDPSVGTDNENGPSNPVTTRPLHQAQEPQAFQLSPAPASSDDAGAFPVPASSAPVISTPAIQNLQPTAQDSPNLLASTAMAASAVTDLKEKQAAGTHQKRDIVVAYIGVAKVAEQESSPDSPAVNGLLRDIAGSATIDLLGGDTAKQWFAISSTKRPTSGVLIIGTTDATGRTIMLPTGETVSVISPTGNSLPASAKVIALGQIIDSAAMTVIIKNVVSL